MRAVYCRAIASLVEYLIARHGVHVAGEQFRLACRAGGFAPDTVAIIFSADIHEPPRVRDDDRAIARKGAT